MKRPKFKITFILCFMMQFSFAQKSSYIESLNQPNAWVDSVFKSLSKKEKIGQLFMIRAHSNKSKKFEDSVAKVIKKEHIGGLVFFQGGPGRQVNLTNRYQKISKIPLWIATDAEWGVAMRLDSISAYPYQMTLGAIQNNDLIYQMGLMIGNECKRLGVHINFAPVMDINNNPNNPVINYRSFGEDKLNVAAKSIAYMKGLQDAGLITSAKHFPGHGDTDTDSHLDLPQLNFTRKRLDSLELYPFKMAINENLSGMMVAHMNIPSLDATKNLPSTLSKPIVTDLLKNNLNFKGLVFSDAMEMKGVVKYFPNGKADVKALIAGIDVIELSENSLNAEKLIRKAIHRNQITWQEINQKVKKILYAKYWLGLHQYQKTNSTNVVEDIHTDFSQLLKQKLADAAITIIKQSPNFNKINFVEKIAVIDVGMNDKSIFSKNLNTSTANFSFYNLPKNSSSNQIDILKNELNKFDRIIIAIHDTRKRPASTLDYSTSLKNTIAEITNNNTSIVFFANPYALNSLPKADNASSIVIAYQDAKETEIAAAKLFNNELKASGKLPVTINSNFKFGDGIIQP